MSHGIGSAFVAQIGQLILLDILSNFKMGVIILSNTSLAGQRFTSKDEKPYCADCYGELFAKRCSACVKPITVRCTRKAYTYCSIASCESRNSRALAVRSSSHSRIGTGITIVSFALNAVLHLWGRVLSQTAQIYSAQSAQKHAWWRPIHEIGWLTSTIRYFTTAASCGNIARILIYNI